MLRRGRRVAVLTLLAGAVVATVVGWLVWLRIVEERYLARLDSEDPAVRLEAANQLAERRSLRAISYLMNAIEKDRRERAIVVSKSTLGVDPRISFTPIAHALYRTGPMGIKRLEEAVLRAQPADGIPAHTPLEAVRPLLEPPEDLGLGIPSGSPPGLSSYVTFVVDETWLIGATVLLCWRSPELRVEARANRGSP